MNKQELKDIEWLKKFRNNQEEHSDMWYLVDEIIHETKKLENPETLSQKWIDENAIEFYTDTADAEWHVTFRLDDLQTLLVPKQEEVDRAYKDGYEKGKEHATKVIKPTIPKFIAEVIEEDKERGYDVYDSIDLIIETDGGGLLSISDWVARNIDKYARAWLYGYTVEEKLKYFAKIKGHENIGSDDKYWNYCITDESLDIGDNKVHADVLAEYVLNATKDEWENLGINDDNADFIKVEGMEEC